MYSIVFVFVGLNEVNIIFKEVQIRFNYYQIGQIVFDLKCYGCRNSVMVINEIELLKFDEGIYICMIIENF